MDEAKEREAIRELGYVVAEIDYQVNDNARSRLEPIVSIGLPEGTADRERFTSAYANKLLELKTKGKVR